MAQSELANLEIPYGLKEQLASAEYEESMIVKLKPHLILIGVVLSIFGVIAAENVAIAPSIVSSHEVMHSPVLKVYEAKDGKHRFLAYVVKWKDSEIVVSDTLVRTRYKVGDMLPVLVVKTAVERKGSEPVRNISFEVARPNEKLTDFGRCIPNCMG